MKVYNNDMNLYLGCPVWSFKGWVGNFYPKKTKPSEFLREYAKRLTTIEGNTTFYATPSRKTMEGWLEDMPEMFRFCPKVPKMISHSGKLTDQLDAAKQFVEIMSELGSRLGPMFLQLPPGFSPRLMPDLAKFLAGWPQDVRLGVEVRHLGWFEDENRQMLNDLLASRNMARVVIDTRPMRDFSVDESVTGNAYDSLMEARERKPDVPVFEELTADFTFLRFIGHPDFNQNQVWVDEWVNRITDHLKSGVEPYVFCHTPDNLQAPNLCREFYRQIASRIEVPKLPWDEAGPDDPIQTTMF